MSTDAAGFRMGLLGPDQAAGAGDAVFGADVGDFHGCWIILSHVLIDLYYLVQAFADFGKK